MIHQVSPEFKECNAVSFPNMIVYLEGDLIRLTGTFGNSTVVASVISMDPADFTPDSDMAPFTRDIGTSGRADGGEFAAFSTWAVELGFSLAQVEDALSEWFDLWGFKDGSAWGDANPII